MFNGQPSRENLRKYRGVFASPLDYDMAQCAHIRVEVHQHAGSPINYKDVNGFKRINRLKSLGGVREPLTNKSIDEIFESLTKKNSVPMLVSS